MKSRATRAFVFGVLLNLLVPALLTGVFSVSAFAQGTVISPVSKELEEQDSPREREQWFLEGRTVPGVASQDLLRKAHEYKMKMREARALEFQRKMAASSAQTSINATVPVGGPSSTWRSIGPSPILPNTFQDYGNNAGRINAVVVDQTDASGNTVYIGAAYGGVWKSTNAASSDPTAVVWTSLTDNQPTLSVGAMAMSPGDHNILLVGTGEAKSSGDSYYGMGILRSTDGGANWTLISTASTSTGTVSFNGIGFAHIAFSSDNPNLVVATTASTPLGRTYGLFNPTTSISGIFYSTNAGATWTSAPVTDPGFSVLAAASGVVYNKFRHKFYAAVRFHGFYESTDGLNWNRVAAQPANIDLTSCPTSAVTTCPLYRAELAIRPDKDEMYTWIIDINEANRGVYRTTDGGASWFQFNTDGIDNCAPDQACGGYQASYNMYIAAVPNKWDTDPNATDIYVGGGNIFKCTVATTNPTCASTVNNVAQPEPYRWMDTTNIYGVVNNIACWDMAHVHPDQHAIDFLASNPRIMYFGNDGGINRTTDSSKILTGSCTSGQINKYDGLNGRLGSVTQFVWASPDPNDSTGVIAGAQDNGSSATNSGISPSLGASGAFALIRGGDGGYTAIDPVTPGTFYTTTPNINIRRCTLGYNCDPSHWFNVATSTSVGGDSSAFYAPYMFDPQNSGMLIVGTCRVWRIPSSSDGNTLGTVISNNFSIGSAGTCTSAHSKIQALALGGPGTANGAQVIYAGLANGQIFRTLTADAGAASWVNVTPPATLNPGPAGIGNQGGGAAYRIASLAVDTTDATGKTVYAAIQGFGGSHVIKSTDGGTTWTSFAPGTSGLPDAPANSVVIDPDDSTIVYVGTDVGVFVTTNGGTTWTEVGPSSPALTTPGYLPNVPVMRVAITKASSKKQLMAVTYGRGIWMADISVSASPANLVITQPNGFHAGPTFTQSQTVTVTNSGGTGATSLAVGSVTGSTAFSITSTTCGTTLAAGANCTVTVKFTAPATYPATLNASIAITSATSNATINLTGTVDAPAALGASTLTAFHAIPTAQQTQTVTVTNNGASDATNVQANLTGSTAFALGTNTCGTTLAATQTCTIAIVYTAPASGGSVTGTLSVASDQSTATVSLTGNIDPVAKLDVTQPATFHATTGGSQSQAVTITNNGNLAAANLAIGSVTGSSAFSITSTTCGTTLAISGTCTVTVKFIAPAYPASPTATIAVTSTNANATINLNGTVDPSALLVVTQPAAFHAATGLTQSQAVTITNNGATEATNLAFAAPAGSGAAAFAITAQTCGTTLVKTQSCTVTVTYTAPAPGATPTATIAVTSDTSNATINLSGTVDVANLVVTQPAAFHAGTGLTQQQDVTITNNGAVAAGTLAIAAPTGTGASAFTKLSQTCTATLAPNTSCKVTVQYTAPAPGATPTATMAVTSDSSNATINLSGTVDVANLVVTQPAAFHAGTGLTQQQDVTITNNGAVAAGTLAIAAPTGTGASAFTKLSQTCTATLAPNTSCKVTVQYTAPAPGATPTATMAVTSDSSNATINLSGTVDVATLVVTQPTSFHAVTGQTQSKDVTITNNGVAAANVLAFAAPTGTGAASFAITAKSCTASLAAGANCTVTVTYTAPAVGATPSATIAVSSDSANATINLNGIVDVPANLSVTQPNTFKAAVGSTVSQTITITNTGTLPATGFSIGAIAGAGASSFTKGTTTCGTSLAGGPTNNTCTIAVTYSASGTATVNATISVTSNESTTTINLQGTPEDFSVQPPASTSAMVTAGGSTSFDFTVGPSGSTTFSSAIVFSATGLPNLTSAVFTPATITPGSTSQKTTLVITTSAKTQRNPVSVTPTIISLLFLTPGIVLVSGDRKRRRIMLVVLLIVCAALVMTMASCGGGGGTHSPGTTPGTYTVTVNATSGSLVHTSTVTITVQ